MDVANQINAHPESTNQYRHDEEDEGEEETLIEETFRKERKLRNK